MADPRRTRLRRAVFDFTEGWYNTRHSTLGYRSPAEYEATIHQQTAANAG